MTGRMNWERVRRDRAVQRKIENSGNIAAGGSPADRTFLERQGEKASRKSKTIAIYRTAAKMKRREAIKAALELAEQGNQQAIAQLRLMGINFRKTAVASRKAHIWPAWFAR